MSVLLILTFSSCNLSRVYVGIFQARNDYSGGEFQRANRKLVTLSDNRAFEPWISYNIGAVYYALGEPVAAEQLWGKGDESVSAELAFKREFNLGVLAYERGAYEEAYDRFVAVLRIDPTSVEAKTNLEFAYEKIEDRNDPGEPSKSTSDANSDPGADVHRLLQYLERLERNVWQSTGEIESEGGINDW